jgi:hypothetical protein
MSKNCRTRYETEANWITWAQAVVDMADQLRTQPHTVSVSQNH